MGITIQRTSEDLTVSKTTSKCDSGPKLGPLYLNRCRILVLFIPLYLNLYSNIQTKLLFTKVLLSKTDETNDASGIVHVSISFKSWQLFCGLVYQARIISRVSPAFLQQFLAIKSFHNFGFLRTDGEGTLTPPCSKLLAQHVCWRALNNTLPPCFMHRET